MKWNNNKLVQIDYEEGHKLVDNGVGDYDLICPEKGKICFIPVLLSHALSGKVCRCGKELIEK